MSIHGELDRGYTAGYAAKQEFVARMLPSGLNSAGMEKYKQFAELSGVRFDELRIIGTDSTTQIEFIGGNSAGIAIKIAKDKNKVITSLQLSTKNARGEFDAANSLEIQFYGPRSTIRIGKNHLFLSDRSANGERVNTKTADPLDDEIMESLLAKGISVVDFLPVKNKFYRKAKTNDLGSLVIKLIADLQKHSKTEITQAALKLFSIPQESDSKAKSDINLKFLRNLFEDRDRSKAKGKHTEIEKYILEKSLVGKLTVEESEELGKLVYKIAHKDRISPTVTYHPENQEFSVIQGKYLARYDKTGKLIHKNFTRFDMFGNLNIDQATRKTKEKISAVDLFELQDNGLLQRNVQLKLNFGPNVLPIPLDDVNVDAYGGIEKTFTEPKDGIRGFVVSATKRDIYFQLENGDVINYSFLPRSREDTEVSFLLRKKGKTDAPIVVGKMEISQRGAVVKARPGLTDIEQKILFSPFLHTPEVLAESDSYANGEAIDVKKYPSFVRKTPDELLSATLKVLMGIDEISTGDIARNSRSFDPQKIRQTVAEISTYPQLSDDSLMHLGLVLYGGLENRNTLIPGSLLTGRTPRFMESLVSGLNGDYFLRKFRGVSAKTLCNIRRKLQSGKLDETGARQELFRENYINIADYGFSSFMEFLKFVSPYSEFAKEGTSFEENRYIFDGKVIININQHKNIEVLLRAISDDMCRYILQYDDENQFKELQRWDDRLTFAEDTRSINGESAEKKVLEEIFSHINFTF